MPTYPPASSTLTLTGDDGSVITLAIAVTANVTTPPLAPGPDPVPDPPAPQPVGPPAVVEIAGTKVTVSGTGKVKLDAPRDTNDLVIYTPAAGVGGKAPTNEWGKEVAVVGGKVAAVAAKSPIVIPSGGFVLSGHFETGEALAAAAVVGAAVAVKDSTGKLIPISGATAPVPEPGPVPPAPTTWPAKMIAAYKKMFSGDPGAMSSYSPNVNVVFLAFAAQHTGPLRLVGYSGQGKASLMADIKARQAAGGKVSISIGGAGNPINTSNTTAFVNDFAAIGIDLGFVPDGIDWDLEHWNNTAEIVAISKALKARYGANFGVTFSVGGVGSQADIDNRIATGKALHAAGVLDAYSWQLYDTPVDLGTAKWRLGYCIDRGGLKDKMCVGMMLGSDNNHWDNAECLAYMRDIKASLGLTKTALWTEGWSAADNQWAADMKSVLG